MITLDIAQYDLIKPMFADVPGCLSHIACMENRGVGQAIVDCLKNPKTAYIETPYLFYYFGGGFNIEFLDDILNHILSDLIPDNEIRPIFIFSTDQQWKDEIEKILQPRNNSGFGPYLTRRLHHLNIDKYKALKEAFNHLPEKYTLKVQNEDGEIFVRAFYNGDEVCVCHDGGQGLGFMDFNVFTHPEHRKKGLAIICSSTLIDYCIEHDIVPQWGCWTVNVPSCNLAEKLGFESSAEIQVNFAEINKLPR